MEPELDLLDRRIRELVGRKPGATILGLLPVDAHDQELLVQSIRKRVLGKFSYLLHLQQMYPAALSYTIALALSRGTTEAIFYTAIEHELGLGIPMVRRAEFSEAFATGCNVLGLVVPEAELDTHTDRHLRPIIFQAGILHYWAEHLGNAVTVYLNHNPCPDLEDETAIRRFARELAHKVPQAQARLRRTLSSVIGPLVCRDILLAFSTKDFDQLPSHLREPMKEARRRGGGESVRSPYLRYSPEAGQIELVLPKQSSKLADYNTVWVRGSNTYSALVDRSLNVQDLSDEKCELTLKGFRRQFQDQKFTVKLKPDSQDPFFIFRAVDGRRVQIGSRQLAELPIGDYDFFLPPNLQTNEEDSFTERGAFKVARVEIFPGRAKLEISLDSGLCVIQPRLSPDLLVQDDQGNRIHSVDGKCIYYGDGLNVHAFAPSGDASTRMLFKVETLTAPAQMPSSAELLPENRGAYHFYKLDSELVRPFLKNLPAAIHEIQITAEGTHRTFSRRFFYWKGFRELNRAFGFVCDAPPRNFDSINSVGLSSERDGLRIRNEHLGAEVVLALNQPLQSFLIAKPGLWLKITDLSRYDSREIAMGSNLEVNGSEVLALQSGDLLPWKVACGTTELAELRPGFAKASFSLTALVGQFGDSFTLEAKNLLAQKTKLASLAKANLARSMMLDGSDPSRFSCSFRLGSSQFRELELEIRDLANPEQEPMTHTLDFTEASSLRFIGFKPELPTSVVCSCLADGSDLVISLFCNLCDLSPSAVYSVDFKSRKLAEQDWQPIKVADKHGLSESRILFANPTVVTNEGTAWNRLLSHGCKSSLRTETSTVPVEEKQLKTALANLQSLLLFKYASAVWPFVEWLEPTLVQVSRSSYSSLCAHALAAFAAEAVAGLACKSESQLSIHTTLIFGSQELMLAQDGRSFLAVEEPRNLISRSFRELGSVAALPQLSRYDFQNGCIDCRFFMSFSNAAAVSAGRAPEFQDFKVEDFFKYLSQVIEDLDFSQSELKADTLLGPPHLLLGVRALNRRFRPLEEARNNNDTGTSLARLTQEIQACSNRLPLTTPTVKDLVRFPNYVDLSIRLSIAESVLVQNVSDLLLTIAGLGRLCASGRLTRERFLERLNFLITGGNENVKQLTRRLSLFMSLAPELFAFYMLFWETVLKPFAKR